MHTAFAQRTDTGTITTRAKENGKSKHGGKMTSLSNRVQVNLIVVERFEPLRKPAQFVIYMQNDEKISGRGTGISSEGWMDIFPACAALLLPLPFGKKLSLR